MNVAQVQSYQGARKGCVKQSRLLTVDDDPMIRHRLTHVIKRTRLCCAVTSAENGHMAWQLYQQQGADLIITDNNMPVMDGISLTKAIRREQPALPIIMVSGSPDIQQQACAAGTSIFLRKPLEIQYLLQNIMHFLPTDAIA